MTDIIVQKKDEVYVKVDAEPHITRELSDYFRFRVPGFQYMPSFRSKKWDGYIYLFSYLNYTLYLGLLDYLSTFAEDRKYTIEYIQYYFLCAMRFIFFSYVLVSNFLNI